MNNKIYRAALHLKRATLSEIAAAAGRTRAEAAVVLERAVKRGYIRTEAEAGTTYYIVRQDELWGSHDS